MRMMTLADLYLDQLQDMHNSERQIIKVMLNMVRAANHDKLKAGFRKHLAETKSHVERLNSILDDMDKGPGHMVCVATMGLVEENVGLIDSEADEEVQDAGLICAAQKIGHYEIATYGCLCALATLLGRDAHVKILEKTLNEEKSFDQSLTDFAMSVVNVEAMA